MSCDSRANPAGPALSPDEALAGDGQAASALAPLIYDELRALARRWMSAERCDHTLSATALVNEAYVRLAGAEGRQTFVNRAHFFHAAAEAMRRILIEYARSRSRRKRGGPHWQRVPLNVVDLASEMDFSDAVALDEAFCRLEQESPDVAEVVRLRFYAGRSVAETADALGTSPRSVNRAWAYARAWLYDALAGPSREGAGADGGAADGQ